MELKVNPNPRGVNSHRYKHLQYNYSNDIDYVFHEAITNHG